MTVTVQLASGQTVIYQNIRGVRQSIVDGLLVLEQAPGVMEYLKPDQIEGPIVFDLIRPHQGPVQVIEEGR